jgi:hypothetical protein
MNRLIDQGEFAFDHAHRSEHLNYHHSRLIFLYRDYKEIYLRPKDEVKIDVYFSLLRTYDNFKGEKFIFKYEDLLKSLKITKSVIEFLKLDLTEDFDEFLSNEEFHRSESLKIGNEYFSDAKSPDYYQSQNNISDLFVDQDSYLYNKYLRGCEDE